MTPRRGDRYTWRGGHIEVGEVDPACRWTMIHCVIPARQSGSLREEAHEWGKQQPTPEGKLPADWIKV